MMHCLTICILTGNQAHSVISLVPGAEEEGQLQENLDEKPHPHYQVDHVHRGRDETREYHLGKVIIIIILSISLSHISGGHVSFW